MHSKMILLALAGALGACGGAVSDPGAGNAAGQAGNSMAGDTGGGANAGGASVGQGGAPGGSTVQGSGGASLPCPVGQPRDGSTCVTEGQSCGYVPANCATCACEYHCGNGQWVRDGTSCDPPPPPPPPIESCPIDRPKDAIYCVGAPAGGCTYIASYCGGRPNGWVTYYCANNVWKGAQSVIERCDQVDAAVDVTTSPVEAGPDRIVVPPDASAPIDSSFAGD